MNSITTLKKILQFTIALFIFSFPLQAETTIKTNITDNNYQQTEKTFEPKQDRLRNPNEYCAKCHKFDNDVDQQKGIYHAGIFHGKHLSQKNPNNGVPITCVSCHGNISENHRRGVKDVMRFQSNIFSNEKPMYSVAEQNQVCFACHQPDKLREKLWAHDVHAMKLPCAACHTLHPKNDKMHEIPRKERVKLCVDCHSEQQKRRIIAEQAASQANEKQEETQ